MEKRIIHIITTIERGGAENAVTALAIAQVKAGHKVSILPLKGKNELADYLISNGVDVNLRAFNQHPVLQIMAIRALRERRVVFHAHLPRAELLSRIALGKSNVIFTRHNAESFIPGAPRQISSLISRWVSRGSITIAISNSVRKFLIENNEIDLTSRVIVIYYGYTPSASGNQNLRTPSDTNTSFSIGTVSRLSPQKNLPLLIQLTGALVARDVEVQCSIVGAGPLEGVLKELVHKSRLEKNITFLGRSSNILKFMQTLDLFVLTSDYEGFGLVLLEAMDAGIPVVASNVSAIPEVLGEGHIGLFEPRSLEDLISKTLDLLTREKLRSSTLDYQRERLRLFSMNKYLVSHDELYQELLNSQ